MNTAANKHKQEGELVVPVVTPALLVRVRLGPGLRTLETCNMQTLGGRKTFLPRGCARTRMTRGTWSSAKYRGWQVPCGQCIGCPLKYPTDLLKYKLTPTQTSFRCANEPFHVHVLR